MLPEEPAALLLEEVPEALLEGLAVLPEVLLEEVPELLLEVLELLLEGVVVV